ncbi:general amidase [Fusarium heterosporum]|uniref:General amidase n=1 Tax=Fusarium heterosporum TaxID=42747 RepID=A0A8H5TDW2_FUSHE|nr:general amidase [Fusarium heterosporum]
MSSKQVPVVQTTPVKSGPSDYEALRTSLLEAGSTVPKELLLPRALIDNPTKDVTGIPRSCGILSEEELDITENYDALGLAAAIAAKKFTSVAVVTAFCKRAIIAHQLTCCLTKWWMENAVLAAEFLDRFLAETGSTVGPLHGVPISVQEHMPVGNRWSNIGFLATRKFDWESCPAVRMLIDGGAVLYCKTNQPQAMMHIGTTSPWGRTLNPHNINLSAGGSTGGGAALIALRGSVLGIGTDVGGSLRNPAGLCGIYGFKTTSCLFPQQGFLAEGFAPELNVLCSAGPMSTSLRDIDLLMSTISGSRPWLQDPSLVPIPWTGMSTDKNALKIGVLMGDGVITPQPPVTRALAWAVGKLCSKGFNVKPFQPHGTKEAMESIPLVYWPDGGKTLNDSIGARNEQIQDSTRWTTKDAECHGLDAEGVLKLKLAREDFRCRFAEHWETQDVDFVICPVSIGPACSHETASHWNYTAFWNYVDYPGITIPTPIKAGAKGTEDYHDNSVPLSKEEKHVRQMWAEGDFEGAPINLQVVARKYHDNELFAAVVEIDSAINNR